MYTCSAVEKLINKYVEAGGEVATLEEGSLGYGITVLYDLNNKLRNFVIKEKYLNEWSSGHTIRGYKTLPKKYMDQINIY